VRSHFLRLGKQTAVYGLGAVAQQILGVITLPIYARVFDPAAYGVVEDITVGMAALAIVIDLGLTSAAQRSYFDYDDGQSEERRIVVSTWVFPSVAIAVLLGAAVAVASHPLSEWTFGTGRFGPAIVLTGIAIPMLTLATVLREVMRLRFQARRYLGSSLISGAVGAGLSVTLVLVFHLGVEGVFAGVLAGNGLAGLYGLIVTWPYVGRRISRRELGIMVAFGLPLIPNAISSWVLQFVDRILLTKLGDLNQVGQYAIANRLSLALLLIVTAFSTAYAPFMLALHGEDPEVERQLRARLLTYVTASMVTLAVVLSLFAREIVSVLAPSYHQSYQAVALVCGGAAALGFSQVAMSEITITRKTKLFAVYASVAAVINIGLNFALIPPWGQVGAGIATAASYIVLAILYYRGAQAISRTPYESGKLVGICALGAVLMPLGLLGSDGVLNLLVKIAGVVVMVIGLRVLGVVGPDEVSTITGLLGRRDRRPAARG
jgi:O-antigen/teichoic acid export membrane protein